MITYATALVPIRHPNRFPILGTLDAPIDEYDELLRTYINQLFDAMPLIENDITVTSVELIKPTDVQLKQLNSIERFFFLLSMTLLRYPLLIKMI